MPNMVTNKFSINMKKKLNRWHFKYWSDGVDSPTKQNFFSQHLKSHTGMIVGGKTASIAFYLSAKGWKVNSKQCGGPHPTVRQIPEFWTVKAVLNLPRFRIRPERATVSKFQESFSGQRLKFMTGRLRRLHRCDTTAFPEKTCSPKTT